MTGDRDMIIETAINSAADQSGAEACRHEVHDPPGDQFRLTLDSAEIIECRSRLRQR
jgi:hypothetical protein